MTLTVSDIVRMKVTVATLSDKVFTLDVSEDLEIENFKVEQLLRESSLDRHCGFYFQAFCEVESGIPSAEIGLLFNGVPLTDSKKSLKDFGVKDGDMVIMDRLRRPAAAPRPAPAAGGGAASWDFSQIQIPANLLGGGAAAAGPSRAQQQAAGGGAAAARGEDDPAFIREMLAANPDQLALLKQNNPRLAEAYDSGSVEEFGKVKYFFHLRKYF